MVALTWFLYFMAYSFLGWIFESSFCSVNGRRWVNRGFLNGPFIPIYGFGAVLVVAAFYGKVDHLPALFLSSILLTTTLEYITSWALEQLFHARWWDYSKDPFNLNGRIYLMGSLAFGVMSVLAVKVLHPWLEGEIARLPTDLLWTMGVLLFLIFFSDVTFTVTHLWGLNRRLEEVADAFTRFRQEKTALFNGVRNNLLLRFEESEFFTERLSRLLEKGRYQSRRIAKAFPNLTHTRYNDLWERLKERLFEEKQD